MKITMIPKTDPDKRPTVRILSTGEAYMLVSTETGCYYWADLDTGKLLKRYTPGNASITDVKIIEIFAEPK